MAKWLDINTGVRSFTLPPFIKNLKSMEENTELIRMICSTRSFKAINNDQKLESWGVYNGRGSIIGSIDKERDGWFFTGYQLPLNSSELHDLACLVDLIIEGRYQKHV